MRQSPEQTRFNSGEYDGSMKARRDTAEYSGACQNMENWVPTAQGAMTRRSGSWYGRLKLDPPPVPPEPPGGETVDPPISYATDGEWHGYSVRRRLNNEYDGPIMTLIRDPTVPGNDVEVDIFTLDEPDPQGIYWLNEAQILQAFIDTGQDPASGESRLSVYRVYDQITKPGVTTRHMVSFNKSSSMCPFAYTGQFGSFAYVNVSADITAPKYARCQMGCGIPWRGPSRNARSRVFYDAPGTWNPSSGDLANGGIISVAALDNFVHRGDSANSSTRRATHGIFGSGGSIFMTHNETNSIPSGNGPGVASYSLRVGQTPGDIPNPGSSAPSNLFATPDQFNVSSAAYKFDVPQGSPAYGYAVIGSRTPDVITSGTTNANVSGGSQPSGTFSFRDLGADADGNAFAEYNYFNFTDWWFLIGDTGEWGGNSCIDDPTRLEELAKTVKLDPENAIPIP